MGEWVVAAFKQKRLAFAQAFDFVRKSALGPNRCAPRPSRTRASALSCSFPDADMPIMTLNQAKMVLQIARGLRAAAERRARQGTRRRRGRRVRMPHRRTPAVGVVPALGWAIKAGYRLRRQRAAMGYAAIEYFEHGGNMAGLAGVVRSARQAPFMRRQSTRAGRVAKATVDEVGSAGARGCGRTKAKEAVKSAARPFRKRVRCGRAVASVRRPTPSSGRSDPCVCAIRSASRAL